MRAAPRAEEDSRRRLGVAGERAARLFAEARGWRTLGRNVRTAWGELDLVLEDPRGTLVFAEVKTRAGRGFGAGAEAVTARKRERLRRAGLACAQALGRAGDALRFDVFSVEAGAPEAPPRVEHIANAF